MSSGIELNKIAASILLSSLIAMIIGIIVNIIYKPNLSPEQRGYLVATGHNHNNVAGILSESEEKPIDISALMKSANADLGANIVKKCIACHSIDKDGSNKIGPHLWNVIDREQASIEDYSYSNALKSKKGVWGYSELFAFLKNPREYAQGTKMSFAGLSKPEDIANVIAFLRAKAHDAPQPDLP